MKAVNTSNYNSLTTGNSINTNGSNPTPVIVNEMLICLKVKSNPPMVTIAVISSPGSHIFKGQYKTTCMHKYQY